MDKNGALEEKMALVCQLLLAAGEEIGDQPITACFGGLGLFRPLGTRNGVLINVIIHHQGVYMELVPADAEAYKKAGLEGYVKAQILWDLLDFFEDGKNCTFFFGTYCFYVRLDETLAVIKNVVIQTVFAAERLRAAIRDGHVNAAVVRIMQRKDALVLQIAESV
jgi:hypothetical protein